ncbi:hypothetical protein VDGL01_10147 [Verticillium dahliae]
MCTASSASCLGIDDSLNSRVKVRCPDHVHPRAAIDFLPVRPEDAFLSPTPIFPAISPPLDLSVVVCRRQGAVPLRVRQHGHAMFDSGLGADYVASTTMASPLVSQMAPRTNPSTSFGPAASAPASALCRHELAGPVSARQGLTETFPPIPSRLSQPTEADAVQTGPGADRVR